MIRVHTSHECYMCPPLHCAHGNECTSTYDVVHDTFAIIAWDANFHVGREQLHALSSTMFHSFCWRVNIMLIKDGICTLANVVIVDPTQADLLHWSCTTWGFAAFEVIQAKKKSYHDRHPTYYFLLLAIEVFGCLDKQIDVFLHDCANVVWNFKGLEGLLLYVLVTVICQTRHHKTR